MRRTIRTLVLAIAVACFTSDSFAASAQTSRATIRLGVVPAVVSAQAFVAEDLGIFRKHGLDVTFDSMNAGVSTMAALVGGSLDIGFGDAVAVSAAHLRNLPLTFVAPGMVETSHAPVLALLVKADGPIRGPKGFDGKTIATNALKSMTTTAISAWIDGNGGDSKRVRFVEYPIPQMAAAVANGTVDAALPPEPFDTNAIEAGSVRALVFRTGGLDDFMLSGWVANTAWIAANMDTTAKFVAAMREAGELANRRPMPPEVVASLSKYTKIPPAVVGHLTFLPRYGDALDVRELQPLIDAAAKYGVIDKTFAASEIVYRAK